MEDLGRDLAQDGPITLGDLVQKVNKLSQGYGGLKSDQELLQQNHTRLEQRYDGLKERVDRGFKATADRFDDVDASLDRIAKRVGVSLVVQSIR